MAKQYLVKVTVHYRDKDGRKLVIPSGPTPQAVPGTLVKELLAAGAIVELGDGTDQPAGGTES
ncbi:hypothetical protein [Metapseudomonas resinovorans]|uniref:hypothetical protein n=1 Tax=Metapseudomonas resinovorans TaxID=53412 RepID=UPI000415E2FE|nr:hypothetical protein [Pseudomonas resinovorans]